MINCVELPVLQLFIVFFALLFGGVKSVAHL